MPYTGKGRITKASAAKRRQAGQKGARATRADKGVSKKTGQRSHF